MTDPERMKSLVEEIKDTRSLKISSFIKGLQNEDNFFVISNITDYEINKFRLILNKSFDQIGDMNGQNN